jgi:hypothetical protein
MEERKVDPGRGIGNYMFAADGEFGAEALGLNPTKFRVRRANYNAIAIVRP